MRRLLVLVGLAGSALLACQLLVKVDDELGVKGPDAEAPPDPCIHAQPPTKPQVDASVKATFDGHAIFFAARHYFVHPPGPPVGFDVDNHCTGIAGSTTRDSTCQRTAASTVDNDADGGLDNSFGRVVADIPVEGDYASNLLDTNAGRGNFTVLVQLTNYNGLADDDEVNVAFISATTPEDAVADHADPTWIPDQDTWIPFDKTPLVAGTLLSSATLSGWVNNHTLSVVDGSKLTFRVAVGAELELGHVYVTGALSPDGDSFKLQNVVVGGITPVGQILNFVNNIDINAQGSACGNTFAVFLHDKICGQRDTRLDLDASLPCDSLSFGFGFDPVRAKIGGPPVTSPKPACDTVNMTCD